MRAHLVAGASALLLGAAMVAASGPSPEQAAARPAVPTFTREVAPILYKNCTGCHRPGEIGPMSLLTYEDARPRAKDIRDKVADGVMHRHRAAGAAGA